MSTGQSARHRSHSSTSKRSATGSIHPAPAPTLTPENAEQDLAPCAATSQLVLCAQGNVVLCLRHETLAIERRFDKHREDVAWIAVDNVSERAGRMAVSYDIGNTAIIWDIYSGAEIARFAAYEHIRVASWMRNGNVAFGNTTGNIIVFDPRTSEHLSTRTIFDPVTALAPALDCLTFAIGYMNGSILICTLEPTFTIMHTLSTHKGPSRVTTIAWHGSSSRSKMDMLATQSADGDLRVWSVPKAMGEGSSNCTTIRVLSTPEGISSGPNWCGWSRNGRIVQHSDRQTRLHDVRTKNVIMSRLPTPEGLSGISCYGTTSTMFAITKNNVIQQWNLNPEGEPFVVQEVHHVPAKPPPSPPGSIGELRGAGTTLPPVLPTFTDSESSEPERSTMSPLQRIAREMDQIEEEKERRDRLAPLSPASSRSSTSSKSSGGRRLPSYLYDKPPSRTSQRSRDSTEFSVGQSLPRPRDSQSIRSSTSYRSSLLRNQVMRSPDSPESELVDLFPFTRARLQEVKFCIPDYGEETRTPELLRTEMIRVVFGWRGSVQALIRDEISRHKPGSSRAVLLAKWLGELSSDSLVSLMASNSLSSSDWMLLALGSIGKDSQKSVGEAFVQRLLEKGEIHPAVAILLGLGEYDDAIEAYVSRNCFMEALLLTCLTSPSNWERQAHLLRKWGEVAVKTGFPELAVRIFSCTSIETTAPWFSPRAQDAVYSAQKEQVLGPASMSPPGSPPSAGPSARLTAKNASLKLITKFSEKGAPLPGVNPPNSTTPMNTAGAGVTPIAQSALSPGGQSAWLRDNRREKDPSSARSTRTATPGGFSRRRLPSAQRTKTPIDITPQTAARDFAVSTILDADAPATAHKRRISSAGQINAPETLSPAKFMPGDRKFSDPTHLPSPAADAFARLREEGHARNGSRDRMPDGLQLRMIETAYLDSAVSPGPSTHATSRSGMSMSSSLTGRSGAISPPLTATSQNSARGRAIDPYISSLEQAKLHARQQRREASKARAESKGRRRKDRSESRGRHDVKYIRPAKRSPSSPIPMSPEEVLAATQGDATNKQPDNRPDTPVDDNGRARSRSMMRPGERPSTSRPRSPGTLQIGRGRTDDRKPGSVARSPSSPLPMSPEMTDKKDVETQSDGRRVRLRSSSRKPPRSTSLSRAAETSDNLNAAVREDSGLGIGESPEKKTIPRNPVAAAVIREAFIKKKELAARELEERRLSLARRPSAPVIPLPGEASKRPGMAPRYYTELGDSPTSFLPPYSYSNGPSRSQSVDADAMMGKVTKSSTMQIGLPATPKAMMHPRYMGMESRTGSAPPVPPIPPQLLSDSEPSDRDQLGPLLPSTTFNGQSLEPRAATAPPERAGDSGSAARPYKAALPPSFRRNSFTRGHVRSQTHDGPMLPSSHQRSPPIVTASIDETIHESEVSIEEVSEPPLLPELQHLAGPPPPPPPPFFPPTHDRSHGTGTIDIAMDPSHPPSRKETPILPAERAATSSPSSHRRGRGSISETSTSTTKPGGAINFGTRIRTVTERMRSTSRNRNKSPPISGPIMAMSAGMPSPYETVLPPFPSGRGHGNGHSRRESLNSLRTKSPYEASVSGNSTSGTSGFGGTDTPVLGEGGWISRPGTAPGLVRPGTASGVEGNAAGGGRGETSTGMAGGYDRSLPPSRSASAVNGIGLAGMLPPSRSASAVNGIGLAGMLPSTTYSPANNNGGGAADVPQRSGSVSAGATGSGGGNGYIRHPKEIRANMPPELLQAGVYVPPIDTNHPAAKNGFGPVSAGAVMTAKPGPGQVLPLPSRGRAGSVSEGLRRDDLEGEMF